MVSFTCHVLYKTHEGCEVPFIRVATVHLDARSGWEENLPLDLAEQVFDGFNHCSGKSAPELGERMRSMSPDDAVVIVELETTLHCDFFGWTHTSIPRSDIIWNEMSHGFSRVA